MPRKKKNQDWLDEQANEINEAFADELSKVTEKDISRLTEKKPKEIWPKVTVGSHSTRYLYEDGRVELITDWDALARDVKEAIAAYEAETIKAEAKSQPKKTRKK